MTNQLHGPEGSIQIPVQIKPEQADIHVVVRHDDPRVVHQPDQKIWTPDGPVKTDEQANKALDEYNAFVGKATRIR